MTEQAQWACPNGHTALTQNHDVANFQDPPRYACQVCDSAEWTRTGEVFVA